MAMSVIRRVLPLIVLSCLLAIFVVADGRGWPVTAPIIVLNVAGIVFAVYNCFSI